MNDVIYIDRSGALMRLIEAHVNATGVGRARDRREWAVLKVTVTKRGVVVRGGKR